MNQRHPNATQRGFSLVELLVSITIGLVILTAIGLVYQTGTNIQRQKEDQDEVNEPVKLITNLFKYNVSMAGYVDIFDAPGGIFQATSLFNPFQPQQLNIYVRNPATTPIAPLAQFFGGLQPVFGCDGAMSSGPATLAAATPPVTLACGTASTTSNSVQFAYQTIPTNTNTATLNSLRAASAATGEGRDCLQQSVPGASGIVINRFFLKTNAGDGASELYCEGSGSATEQPIARGVEEFVVRYQVAQAGTSAFTSAGGGKSQYLTATQVAADSVGWPGVTAVEICVVTATSNTRGAAAVGTASLQPTRPTCTRDSDGAFDTNIDRVAGDLRLWKRSTFTYAVRNAIYATPI